MRTILCVATYLKGEAFIRECHARGWSVVLLTADKLADAAWPREAIDEVVTVTRDPSDQEVRQTAARIARRRHLDRVAARFRDKLTMRTTARRLGIRVPEFAPLFTDTDVDAWARRVPPPWVVKPRSSAAATGIRKVASRDELWPALEALGDRRPDCLI